MGPNRYIKSARSFTSEGDEDNDILGYSMPNIQLQIAVIFFITQAFNFALKRIGLPALISQILAGIIFSPVLFTEKISKNLFTKESIEPVGMIAVIGFQFFMFLSGVKSDVGVLKSVGGKVWSIGILSVFLPLLLSFGAFEICNKIYDVKGSAFFSFAAATTYSITSFPVIVTLLTDLKLLNSELGRLGLLTAQVSDVFSLLLIIILSVMKVREVDKDEYSKENYFVFLGFIVFVAGIVKPALNSLVKKLRNGMPMKDTHIYLIMTLFLGSVFLSHYYGQSAIYAPYIIGLAVPAGPPLGSALVEKFEVVPGLFLPLFVTTCGMRLDLWNTDFHKKLSMPTAVSLVLISLSKFLICFGSHSYFWKLPKSTAAAFALVMCSRGVVELAFYTFLNDQQVVEDESFVFMLFTVVAFSGLVPILVRSLYNPTKSYAGHHKRNLMHSNPNSELQIISCIHAPGDVTAVIRLLDASCGGDSPIAVTVLHHMKLVAQSTPIFISHRKERLILCEYVYSVNVINLFNAFEQNSRGSVSVNAVTAVSPPMLMYDDICSVAVDKLASLIIIPFHIRWWKQEGIIESEDHGLRELNRRVLESAPCSVAILVDRCSNIPRKPVYTDDELLLTYDVGMIFLGGNDDREALTFALRMAEDTRVRLSVVHLIAQKSSGGAGNEGVNIDCQDLESTHDYMILRGVKEREYITYREVIADDAAATASIVRSMVDEHELIIVGRRNNMEDEIPQTAGLKEWCEYPELGVLGDLILAKETKGTCSLFVVQQQEQKKALN
ncbi:unnamed protein product [Dovyalis caffra]|uniref:Cation/H+ exchanger domain-containing protein n=1 Tax=Dovyalis caffra TaxID=77055 RepID=A0AAV1S1G1_9ROSI|nr:unnamed protein product [Dovyalis caffra]